MLAIDDVDTGVLMTLLDVTSESVDKIRVVSNVDESTLLSVVIGSVASVVTTLVERSICSTVA